MKILVTEDDINNGVPTLYDSCPIALALNRQLNCYAKVYPYNGKGLPVDARILIFDPCSGVLLKEIPLPFEANEFANHFDKLEQIDPLEFEIDYNDYQEKL
jgi:hypothetical protein